MQALWMIVATVFFAWMGVSIKMAGAHHTVVSLIAWRVLPSVLIFLPWSLWQRKPFQGAPIKLHLFRGCAGVCSMLGAFYSSLHLPLAIATVLQYTAPLFVMAELMLFKKTGRSIKEIAALLIGFSGVLLVLQPRLDHYPVSAFLAGLLAGFSASIAYAQVRGLGAAREPEWRTVLLFSCFVLCVSLLVLVGLGELEFLLPVSGVDFAWLLSLGFSGMMAQLLLTRAYGRGSVVLTANLQFVTIVFATLFGFWLWSDVIEQFELLGMLMIVAGGVFATLNARRAKN